MVVAAHLRGRGVVQRYLDAINDLDWETAASSGLRSTTSTGRIA